MPRFKIKKQTISRLKRKTDNRKLSVLQKTNTLGELFGLAAGIGALDKLVNGAVKRAKIKNFKITKIDSLKLDSATKNNLIKNFGVVAGISKTLVDINKKTKQLKTTDKKDDDLKKRGIIELDTTNFSSWIKKLKYDIDGKILSINASGKWYSWYNIEYAVWDELNPQDNPFYTPTPKDAKKGTGTGVGSALWHKQGVNLLTTSPTKGVGFNLNELTKFKKVLRKKRVVGKKIAIQKIKRIRSLRSKKRLPNYALRSRNKIKRTSKRG